MPPEPQKPPHPPSHTPQPQFLCSAPPSPSLWTHFMSYFHTHWSNWLRESKFATLKLEFWAECTQNKSCRFLFPLNTHNAAWDWINAKIHSKQIAISNNKCNSVVFILVRMFDGGLMLYVFLLLWQGNKDAGYLLTSFVVCCHCRLVSVYQVQFWGVGSHYPLVTGSHNWTSGQSGSNRQRPVSEENPQRHLLVNSCMCF